MTKYTLYIGLNDKDSRRQEIATVEAFKVVSGVLARELGGGTVYEATGIYRHDDGTIVTEKTLRCEIFHDSKKDVLRVCDTLKTVLNQESIIIQTETVASEVA